MDLRIFGKELTNLLNNDSKNRMSYSFIHGEKNKDHSLNLHKQAPNIRPRNKSFLGKEEPEPSCPLLESKDPQMVPEYFQEALRFLRKKEKETYKPGNYITLHKTVTEHERAKLIDWLCKLHNKCKMFPETLFTIVSLIDQYLRNKEVPIAELQLVGVAALFIAAKFEQTYQVPPMKQLVTCCAHQYTANQILQKEADIIRELNFNLIINSTYKFFEPLSKVIGLEPKNQHLAHYVLELSLMQPKFLLFQPSLIAASVIYLIKKIRKSESTWEQSMTSLVGYQEKELKTCAKELCSLLECAPDMENTKSIKDKFSQQSYHEVTRIKLQRKDKK